jgi:Rieske Fe-S protein
MTNGTVAGLLLSDMIVGIKNEWKELYSPTRKKLKSAGDFASENLNVAKEFFADRLKKEEKSAEELAPGEGAVVQCGLRKIAAYRDESGTLHECSAVCTHLGGIVQWNAVEKSFDCPLHGSRFSATGKVIMGPAIRDLKSEEKDRKAA